MLMERNWIQVFLNKNTKEHVLHPSTSINSSVNIQKDIFFIPISRSCPTEQAQQSWIQLQNLIKKWQQESISRLEDLTTDKWRVPWNKIDGNELLGRVKGEPHRFLPVEVRPSTTGKRLTSRRTFRPDAWREEDDEPRVLGTLTPIRRIAIGFRRVEGERRTEAKPHDPLEKTSVHVSANLKSQPFTEMVDPSLEYERWWDQSKQEGCVSAVSQICFLLWPCLPYQRHLPVLWLATCMRSTWAPPSGVPA